VPDLLGDVRGPGGRLGSAAQALGPRPHADERGDPRRYYDDAYDQRRRRDFVPHRGALILCLGVIGLVVFPPLCPIAWIMGNTDMTEIRAGRMDPEGDGLTQGGRICGILGTVIYGLLTCCIGFAMCSAMMNAPH
jgi:hypothetical protein